MKFSDWAIVFATLLGPVLAVQAQKWLERAREKGARKTVIFTSLMATRAARASPEHVRALNMIDLAFHGNEGARGRTKNEGAVLDAWHEYLDHLCTEQPKQEAALAAFFSSRDELFINLLAAMANERRYTFDRVRLKKGGYMPMLHGKVEELQATVLQGAANVLSGSAPIRIAPFAEPGGEQRAAQANQTR